jgi:CheY-like chemotaxis protein
LRRTGEPVRVAVVDDDPVVREGRAVLLGREQGVQVVTSLSSAQARHCTGLWHGVDAVVVDAWNAASADFDRYSGVRVAQHIRSVRPVRLPQAASAGAGGHTTIVAISRHMPNAALHKRLDEAGVDLCFDRDDEDIRDPGRLAEVLLRPFSFLDGPAGLPWQVSDDARALGLSAASQINALVEASEDANPAELFRRRRNYRGNAERMRWSRALRQTVTAFGLNPLPGRPAGGAHAPRGLSIDDFRALLDIFRGAHPAAGDPRLVGTALVWWRPGPTARAG